jgi:hypothetical protein
MIDRNKHEATVPDREAPGFYGMTVPQVSGYVVHLEQSRRSDGRWYKVLALDRESTIWPRP